MIPVLPALIGSFYGATSSASTAAASRRVTLIRRVRRHLLPEPEKVTAWPSTMNACDEMSAKGRKAG